MRPPRSSCLVSQQKHRTLAERMRGRIRAPRKNSEEEEKKKRRRRRREEESEPEVPSGGWYEWGQDSALTMEEPQTQTQAPAPAPVIEGLEGKTKKKKKKKKKKRERERRREKLLVWGKFSRALSLTWRVIGLFTRGSGLTLIPFILLILTTLLN